MPNISQAVVIDYCTGRPHPSCHIFGFVSIHGGIDTWEHVAGI